MKPRRGWKVPKLGFPWVGILLVALPQAPKTMRFTVSFVVLAFMVAGAVDAAEPKQKGAKPQAVVDAFGPDIPLPPALSELLDPDGNGEISDDEATQAIENFQKLPRTRQP